jgi:hypothetical protein
MPLRGRTVPPGLCSSSSRSSPWRSCLVSAHVSLERRLGASAAARSASVEAAVETTLGAAVAGACLCERALVPIGHCSRCARGGANDAVGALLDLTAGARPGAECGPPAALAHHRATGRHLSPESPRTERSLRFFPALWSTRASRLCAGVFARFERLTRTVVLGVRARRLATSEALATRARLRSSSLSNLAGGRTGPKTAALARSGLK